VTPNLHEAAALLNTRINSVEDLRRAARDFHSRFGCPALVKGGHLKRALEAVDIFFDGRKEILLTAPFIKRVHTHGTGCTYAAAIAAHLARGFGLRESVIRSKKFISRAIARHHLAAGWPVLNSF
jgi:hydroxymethylpyrimidine/phosphomethylpyrimidine kinase